MKALALFVFVASLIFAESAHLFAQYAGTTTGSAAFAPPSFDSLGACTVNTYMSPYQMFPLNVTTANMFNIQVLFEQSFRSSSQVFLYSTFAAATSCTGVVGNKALDDQLGEQGGPTVNDFVYLTPGQYTVVVTGTSDTSTGLFAANVFAASASGTTVGGTRLWNYPQASTQGATCTSGSEATPYAIYSYTPTVTGLYDVGVYFFNSTYTSTWYTSAVVFSGAFNLTTTVDPCTAAYDATRVVAFSNSQFGVFIRNISMTAGTAYTIAMSGQGADQIGYYGVNVFPTIAHTTVGGPVYNPPDQNTAPPCTAATDPDSAYVYTFVAEYPTYIFDTQRVFQSFDTFSYLYSGLNNGTTLVSCSGPGVNFLYGGDTGDIRPIAYIGLIPGQYYTIIVTPYSQGNAGPFALYAMTGIQLGAVPTTGVPSSGQSTSPTSVSPTSATVNPTGVTSVSPTSATVNPTSGATANPTSGGGATTAAVGSGAVQVCGSLLVLFFAIIFVMM